MSIDAAVEAMVELENPSAKDEGAPAAEAEAGADDQIEGSEAEPSAEDVSDPDEPAIENEDADEVDPDAPVIDAPASWAAKDKALFATLPREAQNVILERETERDRATSKALQEAGEARKRAEQEASGVGQYKAALDKLVSRAEAAFGDRWANIDWAGWAAQDPESAIKGRFQFEAEQQELAQIQTAQKQTADIEFQHFVTAEAAKLKEIAPHLADPKEGKARRAEVSKYLLDNGVSAESLQYVSAAELTLADKAMKWDRAQAELKSTKTPPRITDAPAPARPAVRPAAAQPSSAPHREIDRLNNRLSQTRSIDDAVNLLVAKGI